MVSHPRFLVPNLFTSLSFLLGFWAILFATGSLRSHLASQIALVFACHLIIYCALLDKLDGFAAKALNASSEFGAQFDSLADLIAFGIAPAFCMIFAFEQLTPQWYADNFVWLLLSASIYVLSAAARLARYNAVDSDSLPDWFKGLPSTLAGGLNAIVIVICYQHGFFSESNPALFLLVLFQISTALLMISPLLLPKFKPRQNPVLNTIQLAGIAFGYFCGFAMIYTEMIGLLVAGYAIGGFIYGLSHRKEVMEGLST